MTANTSALPWYRERAEEHIACALTSCLRAMRNRHPRGDVHVEEAYIEAREAAHYAGLVLDGEKTKRMHLLALALRMEAAMDGCRHVGEYDVLAWAERLRELADS